MTPLDTKALRAASFEFAQATFWDMKPVDVKHIQAFADEVYNEAIFHHEFIEGQNRNPNLLVHCLRYLTLRHAIPPMREDIKFVRVGLSVLVELACPNQGASSEEIPFFEELLRGVAQAQDDAEET